MSNLSFHSALQEESAANRKGFTGKAFEGNDLNSKVKNSFTMIRNISAQESASKININIGNDRINEEPFGRKKNKILSRVPPYKKVVIRPIAYGSTVWSLNEKTDNGHTHKWTAYIKPYLIKDISQFVKCVKFKLPSSYENHIRVCHIPPYEVSESGCGEFEIQIDIWFRDKNEKPITILHSLKFLDGGVNIGINPVNSEFYKELTFWNPSANMVKLLKSPKFLPGAKTNDLEKIVAAKLKMKAKLVKKRALLEYKKNTEQTKPHVIEDGTIIIE